jgi:adenosylcobinamide-phosphate synthase
MTIDSTLALTLLALGVEAAFGYPDAVWLRIGHPVGWIGAAITRLDAALNRETLSAALRKAGGVSVLVVLVAATLAAGWLIERALLALPLGVIPLALLASTLLAQRSLDAHVSDVARALDVSLSAGRASVAKIVGRDVTQLDEVGVARAAIESLAENFSDGIVAPALWMALLGLPGALAYKAISTADSMIGHRTPRCEAFGWAAARLDDLANLPASRLSAGLLALAAGRRAPQAVQAALRDAGGHLSPNSGWPEAAMAGALGLSLGGPRAYGGAMVAGALMGDGRRDASASDIRRALRLYRLALAGLYLALAAVYLALHR